MTPPSPLWSDTFTATRRAKTHGGWKTLPGRQDHMARHLRRSHRFRAFRGSLD